jgi:hypothetical protein
MTTSQAETEKWIEEYLKPRYPELVKPFREARAAFLEITSTGHIRKYLLDAIVATVSSARRPLADSTVEDLGSLTSRFQEARDAVAEMSRSSEMHVRFNALRCIHMNSPIEFRSELLRHGLQDRSKEVRRLAGYEIRMLRELELIPALERTADAESDPQVQAELIFNLRLVRDGFCLKMLPNRGLHIWIASRDGAYGIPLSFASIPEILRRFRERPRSEKRTK